VAFEVIQMSLELVPFDRPHAAFYI